LLPERGNESVTGLHGAQSVACAKGELAEAACAEIAELMMLKVPPEVLGGVELRSVGRQILDLDRSLEALHVVAHELAAVRGQAIPDYQHFVPDLPAEGVEKLDHLRTLDRSREEPEVEAVEGNAGDRRELMPVEVVLENRGLTAWGPATHLGRPLAQSRLVDEDDDPALFLSVFFSAGQRSRFQRRIAPSSRSSARPGGPAGC
jgi:hypothetical protein